MEWVRVRDWYWSWEWQWQCWCWVGIVIVVIDFETFRVRICFSGVLLVGTDFSFGLTLLVLLSMTYCYYWGISFSSRQDATVHTLNPTSSYS